MFNCDQCLKQCKSVCCGYVPIPGETYQKYPPLSSDYVLEGPDKTKFVVKDNHCAYLVDNKCTLYEHRPEVCRKFGDETHPMLFCPYQDKDGRVRSRQERRQIDRGIEKKLKGHYFKTKFAE
jgi:Fe-S-cluster containining protein